jgi:Sec-independent protein translocase protein TatA
MTKFDGKDFTMGILTLILILLLIFGSTKIENLTNAAE